MPEETVRRQAGAIASALDWKELVVEVEGDVRTLEDSMQNALCWAGLLTLLLV